MNRTMTTPAGLQPALYDALMWPLERLVLGVWRHRLGAAAAGRVLEIGAGTGSQLRYYPSGTRVTALEPSAAMAARARRRGARATAQVTTVLGAAEALPFAAAEFDTVLFSLAFCSVRDPDATLTEVRRVLVPGGRLIMLEHVHLPWQPGHRLQSLAAPAWAAVAGGCRLDRDTVALVRSAGFAPVALRTHACGWIVELLAWAPLAEAPPPPIWATAPPPPTIPGEFQLPRSGGSAGLAPRRERPSACRHPLHQEPGRR
jgi:SAM-dependent methyltransferase